MNRKKLKYKFKTIFFTGMLALLPLTITYLIISFIFAKLDAVSQPLISGVLRFYNILPTGMDYIPGLGLAVTILFILGMGVLVTNVVGKRFVQNFEELVQKIPLVSNIYRSSKQILDNFTLSKSNLLSVVLVEFPHKGMYSIGFVTSIPQGNIQKIIGEDVISVLVPATPNPTTGFLFLVSRKDTIPVSMTVEEGLKIVMSCGFIPPPANLTTVKITDANIV